MNRVLILAALSIMVSQLSPGDSPQVIPQEKKGVPASQQQLNIPPRHAQLALPETLIAGTFRIAVDSWDAPSKSQNTKLPSGIGRIQFNCPKAWVHPSWTDLHMISTTFEVVSDVTDSLSQLHISEARILKSDVRIGDQLQVSLPERQTIGLRREDRSALIGVFKKTAALPGIRVRFSDVEWLGVTTSTVTLTAGFAWYPTSPASPEPPAEVAIAPGFILAIDSMAITPLTASVRGTVLLPPCMVGSEQCGRASVKLPMSQITAGCQLYREVPDSLLNPLTIGETDITIAGHGYTIDFSTSQSDASMSPALPGSWEGVVLHSGMTPDPGPDTVISNRGYLRAKYKFTGGLVIATGFAGRLHLVHPFVFRSLDPFDYLIRIEPPNAFILLDSCRVVGGEFVGNRIRMPVAAIRDLYGHPLSADYDTLRVQRTMDLFGTVKVPGGFTWGEYSRTRGEPRFFRLGPDSLKPAADGFFFISAAPTKPFYPVVAETFTAPVLAATYQQAKLQGLQGITIPSTGRRKFTILTQDVPGTDSASRKLEFDAKSVATTWMNVISTGVHTEIRIFAWTDQQPTSELGPTWCGLPKYLGERPFKVTFRDDSKRKEKIMKMRFVESSTWESDLQGEVFFDMPVNDSVRFKNLVFTSTAEAGGAEIDLTRPLTMDYWGVQAVPKDSTKSAGVLCVKLGVIYLTAAGIYEPRHFAEPFWLTWGEIKASGNLGRLFFDYNCVGQRFDDFSYSPSFVKLSDYVPSAPSDSGCIVTFGTLAFNFFGTKPLWVYDWKSTHRAGDPFDGRTVRTPAASAFGSGTSDLHLVRDWGDGVANLDFTVDYDSLMQEGFVGQGKATISKFVLFATPLSGKIDVKAERSCISLSKESETNLNLSGLFTSSGMSNIWGCACIVGEKLERLAVGGELSANAGAGFSILARTGGSVTMVIGYSPTRTDMLIAGDAFIVLGPGNAELIGYASFTLDRDVGYAEGYAKGILKMDALIAGISGQGELQWHLGTDNETIQGRVAVSAYGMGWPAAGAGVEAGMWIGINSDKSKIWVMDGISGRFGLNKGGLPAKITGFYAYLSFSASMSWYVVSGGYQVYAGVGAVVGYGKDSGAGFGLIGNVGVYVWGKILGGLVSADAWGNLQMVVGIPPAFSGEIGLEACVLWVICGSVTVHGGFNSEQGFFLY
jgi:hypothetical protein